MRPSLLAILSFCALPSCTALYPFGEFSFDGGSSDARSDIADAAAVDLALEDLDGVMIGRHAYHEPWFLAQTDGRWFGDSHAVTSREDVVQAMREYAVVAMAAGAPLRSVTRHMLGLYQGLPGARAWRRMLSDNLRLAQGDANLILDAAAQVRPQRLAA